MKLWLASTDAALVVRYFEFGLLSGVLTAPDDPRRSEPPCGRDHLQFLIP
jgi:hypothetical protein